MCINQNITTTHQRGCHAKYSTWKRNRQLRVRDCPGRGDAPELPELFRNRPSAPAEDFAREAVTVPAFGLHIYASTFVPVTVPDIGSGPSLAHCSFEAVTVPDIGLHIYASTFEALTVPAMDCTFMLAHSCR